MINSSVAWLSSILCSQLERSPWSQTIAVLKVSLLQALVAYFVILKTENRTRLTTGWFILKYSCSYSILYHFKKWFFHIWMQPKVWSDFFIYLLISEIQVCTKYTTPYKISQSSVAEECVFYEINIIPIKMDASSIKGYALTWSILSTCQLWKKIRLRPPSGHHAALLVA